MKRFFLFVFLIMFVVSGIMLADGHEREEIERYKEFLTSQNWVISEYTAFPYHDIDGDGIAHFNIMHEIHPHILDDEWVFNEDGTYYIHQAKLEHEFYVTDAYNKGTWELIDNGTVLKMTGKEYNGKAINHSRPFYILELGPHSFQYFDEVNRDGININVLMRLVPAEAIHQKVLSD